MPHPQVPYNPPEDPRDKEEWKGGAAELKQNVAAGRWDWGGEVDQEPPEQSGCFGNAAAIMLTFLAIACAYIGHKYGVA